MPDNSFTKLLLKNIWKTFFILFLFFLAFKTAISIYAATNTGITDAGGLIYLIFKTIFNTIIDELFSAFLIIIVFHFFYEIHTEKERRKIMRMDIIEAINSNKEHLALFTTEARSGFINSIVQSIIGDTYGGLLYENMIKGYLESTILYRKNFKNDVEIAATQNNFMYQGSDVLLSSDYYCIHQVVEYEKYFNKVTNPDNIDFKIVFVFDETSLNNFFTDESVYFREVLQIENLEIFKRKLDLVNWDERQNVNIVCNFFDLFNIKILFFDEENQIVRDMPNFAITYAEDKGAIIITTKGKADFNKVLLDDNGLKYYHCKLSFAIPMSKKVNRFHFALSNPTIKPAFSIRFGNELGKIDYFLYLSNSSQKLPVEQINRTYKISSSEIIYPRSGVVFFWQN